MLRQSDMIIADTESESWWQQINGQAIAGKYTNKELNIIPSILISVEDFFKTYPDGLILSKETGTTAEGKYGINPYAGYDGLNNKPWRHFFDHTKLNNELPPMERVLDVKSKDSYKLYPFSIISKKEGNQ